MKRNSRFTRRGFTLIELSVAMMMGLLTGSMVLALFNQQLAFLDIYQKQDFLTQEAPIISMYVNKLVGKADRFRLYDSLADALAKRPPQDKTSAELVCPVVVLNYRLPDGTMRASILSFEDRGSGRALYYYVVPTSGVLGEPEWAITSKPHNVQFAVAMDPSQPAANLGVLRLILTGPSGERITYAGTMQQ